MLLAFPFSERSCFCFSQGKSPGRSPVVTHRFCYRAEKKIVPLKEKVAYLFPAAVDRSASPDQLRITLSWCEDEPSSRRIMRSRLPSVEGW